MFIKYKLICDTYEGMDDLNGNLTLNQEVLILIWLIFYEWCKDS